MRRCERPLGAALLGVLLLAFALRVWGLDQQELRGDEAFGYFFSLAAPQEIVARTLDLAEPHPVASYWLQHYWLQIAGHSEFALRFLSVWWGTLAVALLYGLGRRLFSAFRAGSNSQFPPASEVEASEVEASEADSSPGAQNVRWVAGLGALLLAVSPYAVWHAQDARMYSMSMALTLASTCTAVSWQRRAVLRSGAAWLSGGAYALVSWLALHTHYYAGYVVLAQAVALGSLSLLRRDVRRMAMGAAILLVLALAYLPWLWQVRTILAGYSGNGDSPGAPAAFARAMSVFWIGEAGRPLDAPAVAVYTGGLSLLVGLLGLWQVMRWRTAAGGLLLFYWVLPVGLTWWAAQTRPIFDERYLIAAAPPVYLLMAAAVVGSARIGNSLRFTRLQRFVPRIAAASPALLLLLLLLGGMGAGIIRGQTLPAYSKTRGWRTLAGVIEQWSRGVEPPKLRIAQNYPDPTLWYYYRGPVDHLVLPPQANDRVAAQREVDRLLEADVARVMLVEQPAPGWDDNALAATTLAEGYASIYDRDVGDWRLTQYARPPQALNAAAPDVQYANGLLLTGYALAPERFLPGGILSVHLHWELPEEWMLPDSEAQPELAVSVQLLDADGRLAAQADRRLQSDLVAGARQQTSSYGILLPSPVFDESVAVGPDQEAEAAPGSNYAVGIAIYEPAEPDAPRILTENGLDWVELAPIQLEQQEE